YDSKDVRNLVEVLREAATEEKMFLRRRREQAVAPSPCGDMPRRESILTVLRSPSSPLLLLEAFGVDFSCQKNYIAQGYLKMMWHHSSIFGKQNGNLPNISADFNFRILFKFLADETEVFQTFQ
ncbi:unnamed protein product, partial [Thlaspi arvense]